MYEHTAVIARNNPISKRISTAYKQLKAQKKKYDADYCYVFLLAAGFHQSVQLSKFETTLYGDKDIIPMGDEFHKGIKKCFYFTDSDFYQYKDTIDGALVLGGEFSRLCINNLSVNYPDSKESNFVKAFHPNVLDPLDLEKIGEAYIVEGEINRSDDQAVTRYICEKYGLKKIVPFYWPQYDYTSQIKIKN